MGRRIPTPQGRDTRDHPVDPGPGPGTCGRSQTTPGSNLSIGPVLAQTIRHFLPKLNDWIDEIEDPRFLPFVTYSKRFMVWWGLMLFLPKLSSRRQLDFQLSAEGTEVLANLNRLADAEQTSRPVNKTLEHFLGGIGDQSLRVLRKKVIHRLIRMKALDESRLQGRFVIVVDGWWCPTCAVRAWRGMSTTPIGTTHDWLGRPPSPESVSATAFPRPESEESQPASRNYN